MKDGGEVKLLKFEAINEFGVTTFLVKTLLSYASV